MKYVKHYLRVVGKILSTSYRYSKPGLLYGYGWLLFRSVLYHKITLRIKKPAGSVHEEKVLGYVIRFFSYPQLINLFEEIFIYEAYGFAATHARPVIFDCGSNIGLSILYFKKIYPACRIVAFEPDPETFRMLEENIRRNKLPDVSLFNVALDDADREAILYKRAGAPGSLSMSLIGSPGKPLHETVQARRLSGYLHNRIDLLKMDVEGSEINIIRDMTAAGKTGLVEKMIIEYHVEITHVSTDDFMAGIRGQGFLCHAENTPHPASTDVMVHCVKHLTTMD